MKHPVRLARHARWGGLKERGPVRPVREAGTAVRRLPRWQNTRGKPSRSASPNANNSNNAWNVNFNNGNSNNRVNYNSIVNHKNHNTHNQQRHNNHSFNE